MTTLPRALLRGLAAAAALGATLAVQAQPSAAPADSASAAKAGDRFLVLTVGKSHYGTSCGNVKGLTCFNTGTSKSLTAGNMFSPNIGAEISYLHLGRAERANGWVEAKGLNLSLVGRMSIGDGIGVWAKLGSTFGKTTLTTGPSSAELTGRASGWGLGYGIGLDVNVAGSLSGRVGWEHHDFHFPGEGNSPVQNITLGLGYRF